MFPWSVTKPRPRGSRRAVAPQPGAWSWEAFSRDQCALKTRNRSETWFATFLYIYIYIYTHIYSYMYIIKPIYLSIYLSTNLSFNIFGYYFEVPWSSMTFHDDLTTSQPSRKSFLGEHRSKLDQSIEKLWAETAGLGIESSKKTTRHHHSIDHKWTKQVNIKSTMTVLSVLSLLVIGCSLDFYAAAVPWPPSLGRGPLVFHR